ncbi:MAG TPA: hypothetical protein VFJ01_02565 [Oleiagrimonas sp.]|nr:hypothetical protein [Oleiagrimonas sp.]
MVTKQDFGSGAAADIADTDNKNPLKHLASSLADAIPDIYQARPLPISGMLQRWFRKRP